MPILGNCSILIDKVQEQAEEYGHSLSEMASGTRLYIMITFITEEEADARFIRRNFDNGLTRQ